MRPTPRSAAAPWSLSEAHAVAVVASPAADFLASRSWRGLEAAAGPTSAAVATPGRVGVAAGYANERQTLADADADAGAQT